MGLAVEELREVEELIARSMEKYIVKPISFRNDSELLERIVRVEETLVQQQKNFDLLIHQMDKRFEQMDKRFEQIDKRFDLLIHQMDKRFEQVDKRFSILQWSIGLGFTILAVLMSLYNFLS